MKKVAIIGVGLIGGSLGMALKKSRKFHVLGIGRHSKNLKQAKKLRAIDEFTTDFSKGVADADIIVVSTPVDLIAGTIRRILPFIKKNAVITDVGSVKGKVLSDVSVILKNKAARKKNLSFVGAHPMAGSEKAGINFASPSLFKGATVAVVENGLSTKSAFNEIKKMWLLTGARIKAIGARKHDAAVSFVSHLPHIIAFDLCLTVGGLKNAKEVSSLSAGSFRDITRVADSNPKDWAAICSMNKNELKKTIDLFITRLHKTKIKLGDKKALEKLFSDAKSARLKLLKAGA